MAEWIWYPGEFECWLYNKVHTRRKDYNGAIYPPIWQMDPPNPILWVRGTVDIPGDDTVTIEFQGEGTLKVDGRSMTPPEGGKAVIPRGRHDISARVYNKGSFPALRITGEHVNTPGGFTVGLHESTFTAPQPSGFIPHDGKPEGFALPRVPVEVPGVPSGPFTVYPGAPVLLDCGREMYGYLGLTGIKGTSPLTVRFGESPEEASSPQVTQYEIIPAPTDRFQQECGSAFRYISLTAEISPVDVGGFRLEEELGGSRHFGSFECDDEFLNGIWRVSARTLDLCSREFFLDGIKRDHWVWSGDALQEILMSFYLYWDPELCKRTISALRGKDPVPHHINRIMDYSFYWILTIWTYYCHTGDREFLKASYPRVRTLLDYCAGRENGEGFMAEMPGDWIFVDWAPIDNSGEVALEQILYAQALERAGEIAEIAGDDAGAKVYGEKGRITRDKALATFWDEGSRSLLHNRRTDGTLGGVTKYASMFALFFGYLDEAKRSRVVDYVLTDPEVLPITTPYMRFYELEALCQMGRQEQVKKEIMEYWGDMLKLGATSFWELYDPKEQGVQHYAMYGDAFGKSLCHGWGASPLYLLGKYFLGVYPTSPGYGTFEVKPNTGGLRWMKGTVPMPTDSGSVSCISVEVRNEGDAMKLSIDCPEKGGSLILPPGRVANPDGITLQAIGIREDGVAYALPKGRSEFVHIKE